MKGDLIWIDQVEKVSIAKFLHDQGDTIADIFYLFSVNIHAYHE